MNETCPDCAAPIHFARSERGHWLKLNPEPDRLGTVALISDGERVVARVLEGAELATWRGQLWMPHWATCPHNGSKQLRWQAQI